MYKRLFEHTPAMQSEATFLYNEFEQHPRAAEFDSLLHASHRLNEALDCEAQERLAAAPLSQIATQLEAAAASLQRLTTPDPVRVLGETRSGVSKEALCNV